jgi:outer membrane protein OmpA-like peptidoglycan-associated protein
MYRRKILLRAAAALLALASAGALPALSQAPQLAASVALRVLERLTPELTEPPARFRVRLAQSDPFGLDEPEDLSGLKAWQLQILDSAGRKVSYLQGSGDPTKGELSWSGTDAAGKPLPDGFYAARLVWLDAGGAPRHTGTESLGLVTPLELKRLSGRGFYFNYTEEGLVITLSEKLVFRPGSSELQDASLPAMSDLRSFLAANPRNKVTVRGYTDSSGSAEVNMRLSRERAARVHAYLTAAGIPPSRIVYIGLGPTNPVAANTTPEGRAHNRRVDVIMHRPEDGSLY